MKKLLLLVPVFLFLAASCSTDSDAILQDTNAKSADREATFAITPKVTEPCFKEINAHVYNQGTFTNPVISFIADVPTVAPPTIGFKLTIELQATDCEDINSGYGTIKTFTEPTVFYNISGTPAHIELLPSETLPCYRWRILLQGFTATNKLVCASYSKWYDAPIL